MVYSGRNRPDGSIPFVETLVMPEPGKSLDTTVYRKPSHTDQYLQKDNCHNIATKYSVVNT